MKKKLIIGITLTTILLTGCSKNKKVECAFYEETNDAKISYDYLIKYDETGNYLQEIKYYTEFFYKNENQLDNLDEAGNLCENFLKDSNGENRDYVICKQENKKSSISVDLTLDVRKMNMDQREELIANFDMTFDEFKKKYEETKNENDYCVFNSKKKMQPVKMENGVLGLLNDSKISAAEDTTYGLIRSAEMFVATYMMENNGDMISNVTFKCDGKKCASKINGKEYKIDYKGTIPTSGSIYIDSDGYATIKNTLIINGYNCNMSGDNKVRCSR